MSLKQKQIIIQEIGRAFLKKNSLTLTELQNMCSCKIDHNDIYNLTKANILISNNKRPVKYSLNQGFNPCKMISEPGNYASLLNATNKYYLHKREAKIADYKREISRLKILLKENGIDV